MQPDPKPRILAMMGGAVMFGQERGNIEALVALKEQGADVLCLVRDESWALHMPLALDARGLAWRKVPYIEHWMPARWFWFLFRNPIAFIVANWRFFWIARTYRPTHIHCCSQIYILNFLLALLVVRHPLVFRAGDQPSTHRAVWRALWCFVVWRTTAFVANAQFVAQALRSNGVEPERIAVIYNSPPKRPTSPKTPVPFKRPSEARIFTFIGQIGEHKGPHVLIDAFRLVAGAHPDVHLMIAGRISDWEGDLWAQALRDSVASDPLIGQRVSFLGEVADVCELLALSEVLVVPSVFEDPSPNVVMEAKQAGRPCIVFPRGGLPELIQDGVDGLICRDASVAGLVHALRIYLNDRSLASVHGRAALTSLDQLGVLQFGRRWLDVYNAASRCAKDKHEFRQRLCIGEPVT